MSFTTHNSLTASHLLDSLRQHASGYGYELVETPIIDGADLFLTKAGDQLITRLFTFERHGRQLALRPEFTAGAAHRYVHRGESQIVRWQFSGPIFEDVPGETQQQYQRLSMGAELIGMSGPAADAEIISLAASGLLANGVSAWRLIIGHVGLTRRLLERFGLDQRTQRFLLNHLSLLKQEGKQFVLERLERSLMGAASEPQHSDSENPDTVTILNTRQMLDVLLDATQRGATMGGRTRQDIARRLLEKRQRAADHAQIAEALDFLEVWGKIHEPPDSAFETMRRFIDGGDALSQGILDSWQAVLEVLDTYEVPLNQVVIQPDLARSWDYYTGIVFELRGQNGAHLGGGGRYDDLISLVAGQQSVPAVGFAYDIDSILSDLEISREISVPAGVALFFGNAQLHAAARWASKLRKRGLEIHILPENTPTHLTALMRLDAEGRLWFGALSFSLDDIDDLAAQIQKV